MSDADDVFVWRREPWGEVLRCEPLAHVAPHFFTTRSLPIASADDTSGWRTVATAAGVPPGRLARLKQVHGNRVVLLDTVPRERPTADAAITASPHLALAVQVADCVPMLIADRARPAVAAVHAGWRGTAAGIAQEAVAAMRQSLGSRPEDLLVAFGPSIGACCYTVGPELPEAFDRWPQRDRWFSTDAEGTLRLDVSAANRDQLQDSGVRPENIFLSGLCTATERDRFYSYRADGPGTGRMAGVIRVRTLV